MSNLSSTHILCFCIVIGFYVMFPKIGSPLMEYPFLFAAVVLVAARLWG